jgi:hypothetical protein
VQRPIVRAVESHSIAYRIGASLEYREFQYFNEFGGLDLEHGSKFGTALSWLAIKALYLTLCLIFLGIGVATWKYFTADIVAPAVPAPSSRYAILAQGCRLLRTMAGRSAGLGVRRGIA